MQNFAFSDVLKFRHNVPVIYANKALMISKLFLKIDRQNPTMDLLIILERDKVIVVVDRKS